MFCPECGNRVEEEEIYCPECHTFLLPYLEDSEDISIEAKETLVKSNPMKEYRFLIILCVMLAILLVLYYNQDTPTEKMIMFSIDEYYPQYSGYVEFCVGGSMAYSYNALIDGLDDSYGYYQILEKIR